MEYSIIVKHVMSVGKTPRAITKQETYQIINSRTPDRDFLPI